MAIQERRWMILPVARADGKCWCYQLAGEQPSQAAFETTKGAGIAAERAWKRRVKARKAS